MKRSIISGVVLALVATSQIGFAAQKGTLKVAQATTETTTATTPTVAKKAKKKAKKVKTSAAKKAAPVVVAAPVKEVAPAPAPAPAPVAIAPAQGVTAAPVAAVAPASKKAPVGVRYRSYNSSSIANINGRPGLDEEVLAWDRTDVSYNFNDTTSANLLLNTYHTWFGNRNRAGDIPGYTHEGAGAFAWGDLEARLISSKLAKIKDTTISGVARYSAFNSEPTSRSGSLGFFEPTLTIGQSFGRFDLSASFAPRYYFQQYNTSAVKGANGLENQNRWYDILVYTDITYNFTNKLSLTQETGIRNRVKHDDPTTGRQIVQRDLIVFNPELAYTFSPNFSLSVGAIEEVDMRSMSQVDGYTPLSDANAAISDTSEYYLQGTVKF